MDQKIRLHLQADVHGGDPRFPLELMFGVPGQLNAELAGDDNYNDAAVQGFIRDNLSDYDRRYFSGGTARMAKSRQMGVTRKGKGRKVAKNGKKTRRDRCLSRRNKEAQRYVVCSGSRGQKSMRYKRKLRSRKQSGGVRTRQDTAPQRAELKAKLKQLTAELEAALECKQGDYPGQCHTRLGIEDPFCKNCDDLVMTSNEIFELKEQINNIKTELGLL